MVVETTEYNIDFPYKGKNVKIRVFDHHCLGSSPKVTILNAHGFCGSGRNHPHFLRHLCDTLKARCISFSQIGHGGSFGFDDKKLTGSCLGIDNWIDVMVHVHNHVIMASSELASLPHFTLGHSLGGGLVLLLAKRHPECHKDGGVISMAPVYTIGDVIKNPITMKAALPMLSFFAPSFHIERPAGEFTPDPKLLPAPCDDKLYCRLVPAKSCMMPSFVFPKAIKKMIGDIETNEIKRTKQWKRDLEEEPEEDVIKALSKGSLSKPVYSHLLTHSASISPALLLVQGTVDSQCLYSGGQELFGKLNDIWKGECNLYVDQRKDMEKHMFSRGLSLLEKWTHKKRSSCDEYYMKHAYKFLPLDGCEHDIMLDPRWKTFATSIAEWIKNILKISKMC
ncbi:hypothetical protein ADUPG1_007798 [Aduncisulcus paluster]|uniref:Serine aminopeptidase S33 domain-containing protein n=1 Tax=Aduncisulcus paluster TaxID=2918883 RepID=A0ABQ5KPJ6_9EUKA|nr:hypothetical protein ADUPG1_007798 [Aduncisulcus paluster]